MIIVANYPIHDGYCAYHETLHNSSDKCSY